MQRALGTENLEPGATSVSPRVSPRFILLAALAIVSIISAGSILYQMALWRSNDVPVSIETIVPPIEQEKIVSTAPATLPSKKNEDNPTYHDSPVPGSGEFRTLNFSELNSEDFETPGTEAARDLLIRTNRGNIAAARSQYSGTARRGFDDYQRAVFLNTVAAIRDRDERLLKNAVFIAFYWGGGDDRKNTRPYGIVLSGITPAKLAAANLHPTGILGTLGRRSPAADAIASLEATWEPIGKFVYAFDVDLYNPSSDPEKHMAEVKFNHDLKVTTHPSDVARALKARGVFSGVITQ